MLNKDYKDILLSLNGEKADFLLVGAYALAVHGYPRATMDIDIWVRPSPENSLAVIRALKRFGAPLKELTRADLQKEDTIFQIGVAPRRIDIITGVSGLVFDDAIRNAEKLKIDDIEIMVISLKDIIKNKIASGRPKDLVDAKVLESIARKSSKSGKR